MQKCSTTKHSLKQLPQFLSSNSDSNKQATVWVVNEESMTVNPKKVTPGIMIGNIMQVDGLSPGDRVVIAGAPFLVTT